MREFVFLTKALADKNRIRIIMALRKKELCVCQITALLKLAPSTVSKHLSVLSQAGLIESNKDGRWVRYCLPGKRASFEIKKAIEWVINSLSDAHEVLDDGKKLDEILKINPEKLCALQENKK